MHRVYRRLYFWDSTVIRQYNSAFRACQFVICLLITTAAFWRGAYPAFSSIKREKREKQHAVFLMRLIVQLGFIRRSGECFAMMRFRLWLIPSPIPDDMSLERPKLQGVARL